MDWVKLSARYYLDPAIVNADADTEVMFTRAIAYAGDQETHGFVPAGMLPALCRRRRYETCVEALVAAGLWRPVRGGYKITRWQEWQSELEAIVARRSADRDRKRRERERASTENRTSSTQVDQGTKPQARGVSRDTSPDLSDPLIERRETDIDPPHPSGAPPPRKRGTRIPADFRVTDGMVAWAREHTPNVDGRAETAKFIDYWQAKAGRDACKLDWTATWRNWMRRSAEQQPSSSRQASKEQLFDRAMARAQARESDDSNRNGHIGQVHRGMLPPAGH